MSTAREGSFLGKYAWQANPFRNFRLSGNSVVWDPTLSTSITHLFLTVAGSSVGAVPSCE